MLLTDLLTLLLVAAHCVSDTKNNSSQFKCLQPSKCCTRDIADIPLAPSPKLTAQARPFDNCFPVKTKSLGEGCKALNGTACKKRIRRHSSPASPKKTTVYRKKAPVNVSASDEKIVKSSRAEFRKLRRFHFGREVPVFGICMCVILDCVLIALICIALQYEENEIEQQEAEAFASFESVHEALLRDAATQTSLEVVPTAKVEKTVTAAPSVNKEKSPEEIRAEKLSKKPTLRHQSDC
ncbi:hypothetical protein Q1695_014580 [Nippostrongylus brasiliensis]|nr:hypothetical protein Q1695_014580 [Nippostrongylus brasiliensis]